MPAGTRRLNILLVEDHVDTANAIARLLMVDGHVVHPARDGADALAAAERADFDLLICDLCLPDTDGFNVMRTLRARRPIAGIAVSGHSEPEFAREAAEAGFAEFLIKPIAWANLKILVRRVASEGFSAKP